MKENCIITRTVISMPSNTTIKKGEKAFLVFEMNDNYVMIEYNKNNYPIPKDAIEKI